MIKGFSILCKALNYIHTVLYFIIGAVFLISVVPDVLISSISSIDSHMYNFIGMIFISKDYFKNKFVNDSMDVMDNSLKLAIIYVFLL